MRFLHAFIAAPVLFCSLLHAAPISYRNAHPVGWMHLLPVGEPPGWTKRNWLTLELNHANIWNKKFDMNDRRNGNKYTYKADFEQSTAVLSLGHSFSQKLAMAVEVPYGNRNGGFLDKFIDQFHQVINTSRFLRHLNEDNGNEFMIRTNDQDRLATQHGEGVANLKTKLKWWFWQWKSPTPGACDCGMAISAQAKFPTKRRVSGLTSGSNDYSGLVHLGVPLGRFSGLWAAAGVTKLGHNDNLSEWPRREWLQMYELSFDINAYRNLNIIAQARMESPLLMKEYLDYVYSYEGDDNRIAERSASGWNSLVEWRGSQSLGLRWRWKSGGSADFMLIEDWALGSRGRKSDWNYVNNAPDIAFVSQLHFVF